MRLEARGLETTAGYRSRGPPVEGGVCGAGEQEFLAAAGRVVVSRLQGPRCAVLQPPAPVQPDVGLRHGGQAARQQPAGRCGKGIAWLLHPLGHASITNIQYTSNCTSICICAGAAAGVPCMHLHRPLACVNAGAVSDARSGLITIFSVCAGDGDPGHSLQPSGAQQHGE